MSYLAMMMIDSMVIECSCAVTAAAVLVDRDLMAMMMVIRIVDGRILHLIGLDWGCFCWVRFDHENLHLPVIRVPWNCA